MLKPGATAPDFTGTLDDGSHFTLSEVDGPLVLYFFPKAFTSG